MTRGFRLAGLLRVRRVQEEQASSVLADRNARLRDSEAVRHRAMRQLASYGEPGTELETLRAVAAARAAGEGMLAELHLLHLHLAEQADDARREHADARRRVRALERLETNHAEAVRLADLQDEQRRLDELAARHGEEH